MAYKKFSSIQQREVVIQALDRAFPRPILMLVSSLVYLDMIFLIVPSLVFLSLFQTTSHFHLFGIIELEKNET